MSCGFRGCNLRMFRWVCATGNPQFESATIPCTARDGVNLSAFGMISLLQAEKGKRTSVLFALNLQPGAESRHGGICTAKIIPDKIKMDLLAG